MNWKWIGLAGILGAAAIGTGAAVAATQRRPARDWTEHTPDEIRDHLRQRLAGASAGRTDGPVRAAEG